MRNEVLAPPHVQSGLSRFQRAEVLGEGAFGVVYRALDRVLGGEVALKKLKRIEPAALLRFKNEFRAAADVHHPNLVRLYELFEDDGAWAFTMELVKGTDFLDYSRPAPLGQACLEGNLRAVILQLVEALGALHAAGLTHRDVKPSNVRVSSSGRAVLLDFGLVATAAKTSEGLGTLEYMAPEQSRGEPAGPAADFYAVGVMLYEALTGTLPISGSLYEVLQAKERASVAAPRTLSVFAPPDLEALCLALLDPAPENRPTYSEIVQRLGAPEVVRAGAVPMLAEFVGRQQELETLHRAYDRIARSGLQVVIIEGESGIGKTSLTKAFARAAERRDDALLVLSGRCHAEEQVPYKLFDGAVDELSSWLRVLRADDLRSLVPARADALAALFPVLGHMRRLNEARSGEPPLALDRKNAFGLFVQLLAGVGAMQPLLLRLDDMQWADEESLALLSELLAAKTQIRALMVITARDLEALTGPMKDAVEAVLSHPRTTRLELAALSESEAQLLSARQLRADPSDPRARRLAREAQGHPMFIGELARRARSGQSMEVVASLDAALRERLASLSPNARKIVNALTVSGAPLSMTGLVIASGVAPDELPAAVYEARAARWVRLAQRNGLTCYHDRLRAFALRELPANELRACHLRLAQSFRAAVGPDAAAVAQHLLEAGESRAARAWLERAADAATEQQAFERAALLYRTLLSLDADLTRTRRHAYTLALSESLSAAGRSADAAAALLSGLDEATREQRVEREILAARQLLRAGQIDQGVATAQDAMEGVGLPWPRSRLSALLHLLWHRAAIRLSGSRAEATDASTGSVEQLDALWGLWQPLSWSDLLQGSELGARHLRLALQAGDARHLGLALGAEALLIAMSDTLSARPTQLLEAARQELARCQAPDLAAFLALSTGAVALFRSELESASSYLLEAERRYVMECPSEAWQLVNVRGALLNLWMNRGDFKLAATRAEDWIEGAKARGDSFAFATYALSGYGAIRHVMNDDPEAGLCEIEQAMEPWHSEKLGLQHFGAASIRHVVLGYMDPSAPYEHWRTEWPRFRGSFLARAGFVHDILLAMRSESALRAALVSGSDQRRKLLAEARAIVAPLEDSRASLSRACHDSHLAQIEFLDGRLDMAARFAERAFETWSAIGNLSRHPSEVLLHFLTRPASEAQRTAERVLAWFASQGFRKPRRAIGVWLPGFEALAAR